VRRRRQVCSPLVTADVSLLPAPMHPLVARHCIDHGKHLVTASYVSPEMKALDKE
jgi:alpha-aminoadipic semialdehyde synthase